MDDRFKELMERSVRDTTDVLHSLSDSDDLVLPPQIAGQLANTLFSFRSQEYMRKKQEEKMQRASMNQQTREGPGFR